MAGSEPPRMTYGFVAKAALVVITVWALAQGLWLVRDILFVGFASILLAVLFSILVDRLERRAPRWLATVATLLVFLGLIAGFWAVVWPQMQNQVTTLGEEVPRSLGGVVEWVQARWDELIPAGTEGREQAEETMQQRLRAEAMNMVAGALPLLNTAIGALAGVVLTIFAAAFFVLDPVTYAEGVLRLVPERGRPRLRGALQETGRMLKRWIAGMLVSMAVIFAATTLGLYLLGVPAALLLGLIAGVLVFIPFLGPTLSAIPALAMALTVSPMLALWVALLYIGIQLLESNLITPVVMKEAVALQPAAILLFQLAMGVLFGFLGLFLAVPLFAVLQVMVERLYIEPLEAAASSAEPAT